MKCRPRDRFRNYPQPDDYIPDNYPKCRRQHKLEIMCGELALHTFEVPLNLDELEGFEVIYKHGVNVVLIKDNYQVEYVVNEHDSIINCTLYSYETKLFSHNWLDTTVQLKFYGADGSISYSEVYKIEVTDAIDLNRGSYKKPEKPKATDIVYNGGYGYTEDLDSDDSEDSKDTDNNSDNNNNNSSNNGSSNSSGDDRNLTPNTGIIILVDKPDTQIISSGKTAGYGYTED